MATTAYLPDSREISWLREHSSLVPTKHTTTMVFIDEFSSQGLQDIEFDFSDYDNLRWPGAFERHLKAIPPVPRSVRSKQMTQGNIIKEKTAARQKQPDNKTVNNTQGTLERRNRSAPIRKSRTTIGDLSMDSPNVEKFTSSLPSEHASPQKGRDFLQFTGSMTRDFNSPGWPDGICGILHDLPDQAGVPGFQRISFMRLELNEPSTQGKAATMVYQNHANSHHSDSFCFEGVVLPGGHMILGRWWRPFDDENQYSTGPFIMWEVAD